MKRHITTIGLLLLAVALGIYLWRTQDTVTSGERQRRENNVFTAWRRDELSRIEIQHEGETIVITKEATKDKKEKTDSWHMTSPSDERVDPSAVERLMTTLEFATRVRKVTGDATNIGLDSPRARGSLTMGTLVIQFALGNASPRPEGSSYFKVEGDTSGPFVVSKELTETLLARADTYRDRTVIPYLSLDMAHFQVKPGSGAGFAVTRTDDRSFKVDGANLLASRNALDKVWGALAEMRAEAFPKNADADRLTQNVRLTITMTAKEPGKPPGELVVGDACPDHPNDVVVLRKQPTRVAACAPKGAIETLLAIAPDLLVDRRPFSFRHDEIEELRLETVGGALDAGPQSPTVVEVARRGNGFHQREPQDRELTKDEADAVSDLLTRVEHTDAAEVQRGSGAFEAVAKARVRAGAHDEVVEVGPIKEPTTVLRRVRDDARLTVSATAARRLIPRRTTTKAHLLLTSESRPVKRVVLRGCSSTAQELVDEGSGLKLVEPKGYETDGSITQLTDAIFRGKIVAWVSDSADDVAFGFTPEGCRVVVAFQDGNNPLTIRFGNAAEGGVYGQIDGQPDVFVASNALFEMAKRIYVSRAALRVEPAQIESVKMTIGGKPVAVRENVKEKVGGLYPDRASAIGKNDIAQPDVEITIMMSEGGPPKKITCSKPEGVWRKCATPSVKAVFDIATTLVDSLPIPPDAAR